MQRDGIKVGGLLHGARLRCNQCFRKGDNNRFSRRHGITWIFSPLQFAPGALSSRGGIWKLNPGFTPSNIGLQSSPDAQVIKCALRTAEACICRNNHDPWAVRASGTYRIGTVRHPIGRSHPNLHFISTKCQRLGKEFWDGDERGMRCMYWDRELKSTWQDMRAPAAWYQ